MVFQGMLKSSGAVDTLSREFIHWRISLVPITMLLPFLVGMVSGIAIAYVGTAFPILISLIHGLGQDHLMLPIMMLAMVSGYVGVLLSPVHLCLLLSNAYFDTSLTRIYKYLWFPCAALVGVGLCYFWLLRQWFGG